MRKRRWLLPGCLAFWLLVSPLATFVIVGMRTTGGMGSMKEAIRLRPVVEAMTEPEERFADHVKETVGLRFPNGEWVTRVAKDTHAWYSEWFGGGTVVLKDSRGRVRCFFGHVCGSCNLMVARDAKSLDEFDAALANFFAEQQWP